MKVKELLKMLRRDGWYEVRRDGSHMQTKHPFKKGTVTVPVHKGDIKPGTLGCILRQAGLR